MRDDAERSPFGLSVLAIAGISLAAAACAPLAQAPLVYSSKVSGGLDLSATSTETPGISINIGYKSVDAAYVPVAVSAQCFFKQKGDETCDPSKIKLEIISASNQSHDAQAPSEEQIRAAATRLSIANSARDQADHDYQSKKVARDNDQQKANDLNSAVAALATLNAAVPPDTGAIGTATVRRNVAQEANDRLSAENAAVAAAAATQTSADAEYAAADAANSKLQSQLDRSTDSKRGDAFSVFGSFNSDNQVTRGSADTTAHLGVGKVFSTGLASQNLTEAMKTVYITECYVAAAKAVDQINSTSLSNDEKAKKISRIFESCENGGSLKM